MCRSRPVSIKDIARAASVSHSTVSRALRNSPLVNAETAARIREIAERQGYRASAAARSLVTNKTRTIGLVVTTIADPFIANVVAGVEAVALEQGYSVFLANSHADPDREVKVVQSFQERRVDGILVESSRVGSRHLRLLAQMKVPMVLINSHYPDDFAHSVMIDNVQGAREATGHLAGLGHERIAYLGDRCGWQSDAQRVAGYRRALEEADLSFLPELISYGDGTPEGAAPAIGQLLDLPQPPTAIFCYDDMSALGALHTLFCRGVRVPEDISLVGFDDLRIASYTHPPLTTVRQPTQLMGCRAMGMLLELLSGSKCERSIRMRGELIVRKSTAPPKSRTASGYG